MFEQVFIADVDDVGDREEGDDHLGLEGAGGPYQAEGDDEDRERGGGCRWADCKTQRNIHHLLKDKKQI